MTWALAAVRLFRWLLLLLLRLRCLRCRCRCCARLTVSGLLRGRRLPRRIIRVRNRRKQCIERRCA